MQTSHSLCLLFFAAHFFPRARVSISPHNVLILALFYLCLYGHSGLLSVLFFWFLGLSFHTSQSTASPLDCVLSSPFPHCSQFKAVLSGLSSLWQQHFCFTWSGLSYLFLAILNHQKGVWLCKANSCLQHQMFNQLLVLRVHKWQMCMNNLPVTVQCWHRAQLIPALKKTRVLWVSVQNLGLNSLWL